MHRHGRRSGREERENGMEGGGRDVVKRRGREMPVGDKEKQRGRIRSKTH